MTEFTDEIKAFESTYDTSILTALVDNLGQELALKMLNGWVQGNKAFSDSAKESKVKIPENRIRILQASLLAQHVGRALPDHLGMIGFVKFAREYAIFKDRPESPADASGSSGIKNTKDQKTEELLESLRFHKNYYMQAMMSLPRPHEIISQLQEASGAGRLVQLAANPGIAYLPEESRYFSAQVTLAEEVITKCRGFDQTLKIRLESQEVCVRFIACLREKHDHTKYTAETKKE